MRFGIIFCYSKYQNPRDKTEALVLLKTCNKINMLLFLFLGLFGLLYLSAMQRICLLAGAIASASHTLN